MSRAVYSLARKKIANEKTALFITMLFPVCLGDEKCLRFKVHWSGWLRHRENTFCTQRHNPNSQWSELGFISKYHKFCGPNNAGSKRQSNSISFSSPNSTCFHNQIMPDLKGNRGPWSSFHIQIPQVLWTQYLTPDLKNIFCSTK